MPEPLGPTMPRISPRPTVRDTSSSALSPRNRLLTARTSSIGGAPAAASASAGAAASYGWNGRSSARSAARPRRRSTAARTRAGTPASPVGANTTMITTTAPKPSWA